MISELLGALYVHAGAPPQTLSARARARNAKQNAPRTSSCSSRSLVVRFVSRFSRARAHVLSLSWAPRPRDRPKKCHFGGSWREGHFPNFGNFWGTDAGTVRAVPIRSTFGQKIFFARTKVWSRRSSTEVYQNKFFEFFGGVWMSRPALENTPPCGPLWRTKSAKDPVLGAVWPSFWRLARRPMYIRGTPSRRYLEADSRKRRAESSQMAAVAPPARIWDDSPGRSRVQRLLLWYRRRCSRPAGAAETREKLKGI